MSSRARGLVISFPKGIGDGGGWQVSIPKRLEYKSDLEPINKTSQGSRNSMQKSESHTLCHVLGLVFQRSLLKKLLHFTHSHGDEEGRKDLQREEAGPQHKT